MRVLFVPMPTMKGMWERYADEYGDWPRFFEVVLVVLSGDDRDHGPNYTRGQVHAYVGVKRATDPFAGSRGSRTAWDHILGRRRRSSV
jgi:hypothetical protein